MLPGGPSPSLNGRDEHPACRSGDIEAIEIALLLQAVYERYGYDFRGYAADSIARRLRSALAKSGAQHFGELQHRVLVEPGTFGSLMGDLVVSVSEMFRDPEFFKAFRHQVIPVLRTYPEVKLWHAGCATGEEVYATAITLREEGLLERSQIYATDLDSKAIDQAREGVYPESQAEEFEANYAAAGGTQRPDDYYVRAYGKLAFKEELRKKIVFFQHSLATDFSLGEMHVIFCRNVLIYFDATLRSRVIEMFARGLCRGGFLCLGNSEFIGRDSPWFESFAPGERIYRRVAP